MTQNRRLEIWISLLSLFVLGVPDFSRAYDYRVGEPCQGPYRNGERPDSNQLEQILVRHLEWLETKKHLPDVRRAVLCNADLTGQDLHGVRLEKADLRGVKLARANLQGADLIDAHLYRADLFMTNLQGANLGSAILFRAHLGLANLEKAKLYSADLEETYLGSANLMDADLTEANLAHAKIIDTQLSRAMLARADISYAQYEPISAPDLGSLAGLRGVSTVIFSQGKQSGLVLLRSGLRDAGLREIEREATYVLERSNTLNTPWLERSFRRLFFEWTCDYGMSPGRPLLILVSLIPCFTILYLYALSSSGEAGIWELWSPDRVHQHHGKDRPVRVTSACTLPKPWPTGRVGMLLGRWLRAVLIGLYFSVLCAFHLGWREFNVGNWITRLQPREYIFRATGWVRVVSGFQSLLSVYLLALWVLTYFGRPFE